MGHTVPAGCITVKLNAWLKKLSPVARLSRATGLENLSDDGKFYRSKRKTGRRDVADVQAVLQGRNVQVEYRSVGRSFCVQHETPCQIGDLNPVYPSRCRLEDQAYLIGSRVGQNEYLLYRRCLRSHKVPCAERYARCIPVEVNCHNFKFFYCGLNE